MSRLNEVAVSRAVVKWALGSIILTNENAAFANSLTTTEQRSSRVIFADTFTTEKISFLLNSKHWTVIVYKYFYSRDIIVTKQHKFTTYQYHFHDQKSSTSYYT